MCRTLTSVDWQGKIYNCDFNQALGMPITADDGSQITVSELDDGGMNGKKSTSRNTVTAAPQGKAPAAPERLLPDSTLS
jgi:hypothetical protein